MRGLLIGVTCLAAFGCDILGPDAVTRRELEVAPYKAGCIGEVQKLCLQVREPGQPEFQNLFEAPIGFDFEWGLEYVIVVDEERRETPMADASSVVRRLDRIVSRVPTSPGTTFELIVPATWLGLVADGTLALVGESIELECPGLDCSELLAVTQVLPRVAMTLRFSDTPGEPLHILGWRACEGSAGPCAR